MNIQPPSPGELDGWYECYVRALCRDPHQRFADLRGTSRDYAKRRCHEIAFTLSRSPILKGHFAYNDHQSRIR